MTDSAAILREALKQRELRRQQEKEKLLAPRQIAAAILRKRFEDDINVAGGNINHPAIQSWIENFLEMYIVLAWPLDRFPEWRDDSLPPEETADFFSDWMDNSLEVLKDISPGLAK